MNKERKKLEKEIEKEIKELVKKGMGLKAEEITPALFELLDLDENKRVKMAENLCFKACYLRKEGETAAASLNFMLAGRIYEAAGNRDFAKSCYEENFYVREEYDIAYLVRFEPEANEI